MPLDLALDLAHALDPVGFVQDRLNFEPDPWQARLLRSRAPWILLNCCRQSGKSTQRSPASSRISSRPRCSKRTTKAACTLANGARLISLPGDPDTLRGYSAPK